MVVFYHIPNTYFVFLIISHKIEVNVRLYNKESSQPYIQFLYEIFTTKSFFPPIDDISGVDGNRNIPTLLL